MKIKNKIVSAICALSVITTMFTVITASADGTPSIDVALKSVTEDTVVFDVTMSDYDSAGVMGVKFAVTYPKDLVDNATDDITVTVDSMLAGGMVTKNTAKAYEGKDYVSVYTSIANSSVISCTDAVAEVSIKLNKNISEIAEALEFNLVEAYVRDNTGIYDSNKNTMDLTDGFKVYPLLDDDDVEISADGDIYTGKSVNLTAIIDAAKLGDRTLTWSDNVTVDPEDQTKAVLTPSADGDVTVTVTVDNNGTPKVFTQTFTATTKIEPLVYQIITDEVTDEGVDVTVMLNDEYEVEGDNPAYTLVAQFYAEDGTVLNWASQDGEAIDGVPAIRLARQDDGDTTTGYATHTFEMEGAAYVRVTAYAKGTNTVIGQELVGILK